MPRFFLSDDRCDSLGLCGTDTHKGASIVIEGSDASHISRSLRMEKGDKLTVCDFSGTEYSCVIEDISSEKVFLSVVSASASDTEPTYSAVLYQALPKSSKFDVIVQKAVETGADRIVPVMTEHCISRPDDKSLSKKLERWQKIAEEAAKQCGRGKIPTVSPLMSYRDAVRDAAGGTFGCLCYEGDGAVPIGRLLRECDTGDDLRFIVGAEGGFSVEEANFAREAGLHIVNLGKRILRCETAGPFVLTCVCCEKDLV